ncbi:MAG TPA: hypothetical protein VFL14_12650 [Xanthomonadales bacterium]|nr:hypothetical protein [Xanthomonadales bacterium]
MRTAVFACAVLASVLALLPRASRAQSDPLVFDDGFDCRLWFPDGDGDDFGTPTGAVVTCAPPAGFVLNDDDCDDADPATFPGAVDDPDPLARDRNCDGIDGTEAAAVFVSVGGAGSGECLRASPCSTLAFALTRLSAQRPDVYMSAGAYGVGLQSLPNVRIFGGFDVAWQRTTDPFDDPHRVTFVGTFVDAQSAMVFTMQAATVGLFDLVIDAPNANAPGSSSYAIRAVNSTLRIERVQVLQGDGADGTSGSNGQNAVSLATPTGGSVGGPGGEIPPATCDDSTRGAAGGRMTNTCAVSPSTRDMDGGVGGVGGTADADCDAFPPNFAERPGQPGTPPDHTPPATGGIAGTVCNGGGTGPSGLVANGPAGLRNAGSSLQAAPNALWFANAGNGGGTGENGGGGAGGGGAGGCGTGTDDFGAGGGGGAAGGCAARSAGGGGGGGGGSFGVFAFQSTVVANDVDFTRGVAGDGGPGGSGGRGQPGGVGRNGGTASPDGGAGGAGGDGAHGGHGGGGAGGQGGDSAAFLSFQSTITRTLNTTLGGTAGSGGAAGISAPTAPLAEDDGNDGQSGNNGTLAVVRTCATLVSC